MSQRLIWADALKGVLILLVILGHAIQFSCSEYPTNHLWIMIYSFHNASFMAVSGYFLLPTVRSTLNCKSIILKRFACLIVPFGAWCVLKSSINLDFSLTTLYGYVYSPGNSFWFLWVLFFISVAFVLIESIARRLQFDDIYILIPACLAFLALRYITKTDCFGLSFFCQHFFYFTLGYFIHKYDFTIKKNSVIFLLFGGWTFLAWFRNSTEADCFYSMIPLIPASLMSLAHNMLCTICAIFVLMSMAPKILDGVEKINRCIAGLGKISLGIYTCHLLLIQQLVGVLKTIYPDCPEVLMTLLSFVLVTMISVVIVRLMEKNKYTAKLFLGKR